MKKMKFIIPILGMTAGVTAITPTLVSCNERQAIDIIFSGEKVKTVSVGQEVEMKCQCTGDFNFIKLSGIDVCMVYIWPFVRNGGVAEDASEYVKLNSNFFYILNDGKFNFEISLKDKVQTGQTLNFELQMFLMTEKSLFNKTIDGFKYTRTTE